MMSNVESASLFFVNTLFALYIYAVILRVLLQFLRADFYNPLSQFIWRITNPPVLPLRKLLPAVRRVDLAGTLIAWLLIVVNLLVALSILGVRPDLLSVLGLSLMKSLVMVINLYTFTILVQAVMSWFGAGMHSPASSLLWNINEPLLKPVRRAIPPIGGLDLSPLFVIILLQVVNRLIPLHHLLR